MIPPLDKNKPDSVVEAPLGGGDCRGGISTITKEGKLLSVRFQINPPNPAEDIK